MTTLIMCIGNQENGDDAVGPYVSKIFPNVEGFKVVNCGTVPENFTHLIKDVDRVVLVDAVDMGLPPGEIRIVPPSRIGGLHLSTHGLPLSILMEYIRVEGREVMLIGVQPRRLHGSMSDEVKQAGEELVRMLVNGRVDELEVL